MTDKPSDAHPAPQQGTDPTPSETTSTKPGLLERLWTLPAVVAVALASVIIGGLGGAALASAADDGGHSREGHFGPGQSRVHRDGELRQPGKMNQRQRERWKQWSQQQRRHDGRPSSTKPPRPKPSG